jgi:hypothetical protein
MPQTTNAPAKDAWAGFAPSYSQPQTTAAPFLHASVAFAPVIQQEASLGLVLLDAAGDPIGDTFARSFEEQLADVGSFSFQMLRAGFAGAVDFDDNVTFKLDGTARFLGLVENLDHVALAAGEEAEQTVTVSGRGVLAEWGRRVVNPSRPVGSFPVEQVRSWSWVGPDFTPPWGLAKRTNRQREYASWRAPLPHIWPDTSAWWIGPNRADSTAESGPTGATLYAYEFNVADDAEVRVFAAGDNSIQLYLDGALILESKSFTRTSYVDIELSAGDHILRARGNNYPKATLPNPGNIIVAGYTIGDAGLLDELVFNTDADWQALYIGSGSPPTFTYGRVLTDLFNEGDLASEGWSLGFTEANDSAGAPWARHREISVQVGKSSLAALLEMSDVDIDLAVAPGSKTLLAWNRGGRGVVTPTVLQQTTDPETSDFLALSHRGSATRVNRYLIRYGDGLTEYEDTASISEHGLREDYLELGSVQSEAAAQAIAETLMENRADPAHSTTATLHPHDAAATPYSGFEVGDWVDCPDENDDDTSMRVVAVTLVEDDNGVIDWPIQLRDRTLEVAERHDVWLKTMTPGAAVGGARVSSRAGEPLAVAQDVAVLNVAEFSFDNTALVASFSPARPADSSGNIVEVYGKLTTAGSTTTTVDVIVHGGATIATLTFPAGATEAEDPISPPRPVIANLDTFQAEITAAGTGAEGLDVQVRAI